jgi:NADPH:quinone reductase-like Zn-dependent oxidoreductase
VIESMRGSGVGTGAIEIVKAQGATSIAVTRTPAKKAQLLKAGADHFIVTEEEDLARRVNEITSGKGARVIFDCVGGKQLEALTSAASKDGIIFIYGGLSAELTPLPLMSLMVKALTVKGFSSPELITNEAFFPEAKKYIYDHLASKTLKPVIAKTFPFSEIVAAHRYMESNGHVGKIVVTV